MNDHEWIGDAMAIMATTPSVFTPGHSRQTSGHGRSLWGSRSPNLYPPACRLERPVPGGRWGLAKGGSRWRRDSLDSRRRASMVMVPIETG